MKDRETVLSVLVCCQPEAYLLVGTSVKPLAESGDLHYRTTQGQRHEGSRRNDLWRDQRAGKRKPRRSDRDDVAFAGERAGRVRRRPRSERDLERGRPPSQERTRKRAQAPILARASHWQRPARGRLRSRAWPQGRRSDDARSRDDRRRRGAQRSRGPNDPPPHQAAASAAGRNAGRRRFALRPPQSASWLPTPSANTEHSDAEIRTAILAELDKLEWAPRASVGVEVQNGAVTFTGSIIDERLRGALKVIAENTPGCVAVHDHMAWIEPNSGVVIPSDGDDPKAETREPPPPRGRTPRAAAGGEKEGDRPGGVRLDLGA